MVDKHEQHEERVRVVDTLIETPCVPGQFAPRVWESAYKAAGPFRGFGRFKDRDKAAAAMIVELGASFRYSSRVIQLAPGSDTRAPSDRQFRRGALISSGGIKSATVADLGGVPRRAERREPRLDLVPPPSRRALRDPHRRGKRPLPRPSPHRRHRNSARGSDLLNSHQTSRLGHVVVSPCPDAPTNVTAYRRRQGAKGYGLVSDVDERKGRPKAPKSPTVGGFSPRGTPPSPA